MASPPTIGGTTPAAVYAKPAVVKGPAAITSFAGTVSTSGSSTTVTFTSAADAILAGYNATNPILGFTLIADSNTRYIQSWTNSTTCVVDTAVTLAGSTAITSVQAPIAVYSTSAGVIMGYMDAAGVMRLLGGAAQTGSLTVSNGSTSAGFISFKEDSDNGTNTVQFIGPASTADVVVTLPASTGTIALTSGVTPKSQVFTQCTTIKDPVATSDFNTYITPVAIHVTATHCLITGATNIVGQFDIADTSGASPAYVDSANMTCTTTISNDVALNGTVAAGAGAVIQWRSTSASATPTSLIACFDFTID
jgi:hypothetical protein